jgi:Fe-S-cluster containining protein
LDFVAPKVVFDKTRASPYSYVCHACSRCCYGKGIQVAPYEVLRLARNLGLTTTEVLVRHTDAGGIRLRVREDGACTFLTPQGCGVHADRPLVCRFYPLGRQVQADGRESFGDLPPHPQTEGVYGTDATVDDYLRAQGVAPYIAAGDRYGALYRRMEAALARRAETAGGLEPVEVAAGGEPLTPWLDVDATVAAYCAARGLPVPTDVEETVTLHIRALEAWLEML